MKAERAPEKVQRVDREGEAAEGHSDIAEGVREEHNQSLPKRAHPEPDRRVLEAGFHLPGQPQEVVAVPGPLEDSAA